MHNGMYVMTMCAVCVQGLSIGWGWANVAHGKTFQRENEISHNHITHWMGVLDDSGGWDSSLLNIFILCSTHK